MANIKETHLFEQDIVDCLRLGEKEKVGVQQACLQQPLSNKRVAAAVFPKGADLSVNNQAQQDEIAYLMNIRPCKRFSWKYPIAVMTEVVVIQ